MSGSVVVPDIHGHLPLLEWVERRFAGRHLILLGDLIHRGPYSRECLQKALAWAAAGRATLLWGNHEAWVYDDVVVMGMGAAQLKKQDPDLWQSYGGDLATLYGDLQAFAAVARPYHVEGDMLCAHAARPSLGASPSDLLDTGHLWNLPQDGLHPLPTHFFPELRYSVHGHTQLLEPVVDLSGAGVVYIDMGVSRPAGFCVWDAAERRVIWGES